MPSFSSPVINPHSVAISHIGYFAKAIQTTCIGRQGNTHVAMLLVLKGKDIDNLYVRSRDDFANIITAESPSLVT